MNAPTTTAERTAVAVVPQTGAFDLSPRNFEQALTSTGGKVLAVKSDLAKIVLNAPACTEIGEKIALSRRIDKHWRLIGWGKITRGVPVEPEAN